MDGPARVTQSRDLGRRRAALDALLGALAVLPLIGAAIDVWLPGSGPEPMRGLSLAWSSCLLAFFGGVRRGLTFSEVEGGSLREIATMLGLFFAGVLALLLSSLLAAAAGFCLLALLDAAAARRLEVPPYFRAFRPVQMGLAAACLLLLRARGAPA